MNIKVNRDVLCFDTKVINQKLQMTNSETPSYIDDIQNREYPCLLLCKKAKVTAVRGKKFKASLTIEAAFGGTMFLLVLFSLLFLFRILYSCEKNMVVLDSAVKEYECFGTKLSSVRGVMHGSLILWDEKKQICSLQNRVGIPFLGDKLFSVQMYQQLCFNAYEGKSMVPEDGENQEYVYVAEHATVYHKKSDCVYLNPKIIQVTYQNALERRNRSGAKYYACKRCGKKNLRKNARVYISPYGDSFHLTNHCPGLKRTVRRVLHSKVGNLPACRKCAR